MRRRNDAPNGSEDISQFQMEGRLTLQEKPRFLESRRSRPKRRILRESKSFTRDSEGSVELPVGIGVVKHRDSIFTVRHVGKFVANGALSRWDGRCLGAGGANGERFGAAGHAHLHDPAGITQPGDLHHHRVAGPLALTAGLRRGLARNCRDHDQSRTGDPKSGSRGHNCTCSFGDEAGGGWPL